MRLMVWNNEIQKYECSECCWKESICADCNDPAERLELLFDAHICEQHQQKAAA